MQKNFQAKHNQNRAGLCLEKQKILTRLKEEKQLMQYNL